MPRALDLLLDSRACVRYHRVEMEARRRIETCDVLCAGHLMQGLQMLMVLVRFKVRVRNRLARPVGVGRLRVDQYWETRAKQVAYVGRRDMERHGLVFGRLVAMKDSVDTPDKEDRKLIDLVVNIFVGVLVSTFS